MGPRAPARYRWLDRSQCRDRGRHRHKSEKAEGPDATAPRRRQTGAPAGYIGLAGSSLGDGPMMLKKRSFTLSGHRTSVALEPEFWAVIDKAAQDEGKALAALVAQ